MIGTSSCTKLVYTDVGTAVEAKPLESETYRIIALWHVSDIFPCPFFIMNLLWT